MVVGTVRHKLMRRESEARLVAAQTLTAALDTSDSDYLLRLLAFELLLKIAVELATGSRAPNHHRYDEIFGALPQSTQADILRLAGERVGASALGTDHVAVLNDLGRNFVHLRYPYEKHGHLTEAQYAAVGESWIAQGADDTTADFRYHPEELLGLTTALQKLTNGC